MEKFLKIIIVGVIILVIGISLAIVVPVSSLTPQEAAVETLEYGYGGGTRTVNLGSGDYEVWAELPIFSYYDEVVIRDMSGHEVFRGSSEDSTASINEVEKLGSFEASGGTYNVTSDFEGTVYITEPINVGGILGGICGGMIVAAVGGLLIAIGFLLWLRGKMREEPRQAYQQPPPGYPQYPPQQYPPQQYPPQQYQQPGYPPPPRSREEDEINRML